MQRQAEVLSRFLLVLTTINIDIIFKFHIKTSFAELPRLFVGAVLFVIF